MRVSLRTIAGILVLIWCIQPLCLAQTSPTTPAAPSVQGAFTGSTSVVFTWTAASDAGSGISGYNCRVGTSPNGSDVFSANVGNVLSTTITGVYGLCYYCSVQAVDNAGNSSNWSASSNGITVVQWPNLTLDVVKGLSDNSSVGISSETVSAIFATGFYVEEQDRSSGLLVVPSAGVPASIAIGSSVTLGGVLRTNPAGERYLAVSGHLDGTWTYAQQNWNSAFGLNDNYDAVTNGIGGLGNNKVTTLGIGWLRCGGGVSDLCNWGMVEPTKGNYTWTSSDADLACNTAMGASSLPNLGYSPAWASSGGDYPPSNLLDYAGFVTNAVTRYQYDVKAYEIWNEPDGGFFNGNINQYTNVLKTAYTAAKLADPTCKVLLAGLAGVDYNYLRYVYERGGREYFDIMNCHPYQWGTVLDDSSFISDLTSLRNTMNAAGDTYKPIWLTEFGWSTNPGGVTDTDQAQLLAQTFVTALTLKSMGVTESFWYSCQDCGLGYGLIDDDSSPKLSHTAYGTVIRMLSSTTYMGVITLASGVRCHAFQAADGTCTLAIWAPTSTSITLPFALVGTGVNFKNYLGGNLIISSDSTNYYPLANAYMLYVTNCSSSAFSSAVMPSYPAYTPGSSNVTPNAVWASIMNPTTTERAYLLTGTSSTLQVYVQNQGTTLASGQITCAVSGVNTPAVELHPGRGNEHNAHIYILRSVDKDRAACRDGHRRRQWRRNRSEHRSGEDDQEELD